jgi:NADPH2:quinone reductase
MRAIQVQAHGDASVLVLHDLPVPEPKPLEARVRVAYAGLNFIDVYQRAGTYAMTLPFTPGQEGSGVVDAVGEGVTEVKVGDRVAWAVQGNGGAYAEFACVPAWKLVPLPEDVTLETAAALMLQGMTAHYLARSTYPLKPGDTALVHAAAGGVGLLLVQIAKRLGATVIATVGNAEKEQLARGVGADETINYREHDFETVIAASGRKLEVVYDSVGKDTFSKGLNLLKPRGMMVLYGGSSGQVEPFDLQILNRKGSLFVTRPSLGAYTLTREELLSRASELFAWLREGLSVRVDRTYDLADAAQAHRALEGRDTKGKVLLKVGA